MFTDVIKVPNEALFRIVTSIKQSKAIKRKKSREREKDTYARLFAPSTSLLHKRSLGLALHLLLSSFMFDFVASQRVEIARVASSAPCGCPTSCLRKSRDCTIRLSVGAEIARLASSTPLLDSPPLNSDACKLQPVRDRALLHARSSFSMSPGYKFIGRKSSSSCCSASLHDRLLRLLRSCSTSLRQAAPERVRSGEQLHSVALKSGLLAPTSLSATPSFTYLSSACCSASLHEKLLRLLRQKHPPPHVIPPDLFSAAPEIYIEHPRVEIQRRRRSELSNRPWPAIGALLAIAYLVLLRVTPGLLAEAIQHRVEVAVR
ncbi:uncharacterized protein LOC110103177 [Dendrobium catenatum]|uniref:uncharacterized protein LOC110103177 n=1 Tax=Dendrobium catenatum TaxID=906689 RepID=UPI0009F45F0D|nr:uncharacterized protein LOC110103177 [Dendrobium catenatum]